MCRWSICHRRLGRSPSSGRRDGGAEGDGVHATLLHLLLEQGLDPLVLCHQGLARKRLRLNEQLNGAARTPSCAAGPQHHDEEEEERASWGTSGVPEWSITRSAVGRSSLVSTSRMRSSRDGVPPEAPAHLRGANDPMPGPGHITQAGLLAHSLVDTTHRWPATRSIATLVEEVEGGDGVGITRVARQTTTLRRSMGGGGGFFSLAFPS